ncbi:hypothetical protein [Pandoraea bronchicola]|uniref:hypothetical protein n=1 Tax=Pandoraea bronchicola TaxID=2508287 RepID=UPI0015816FA7|nr:hypothetical protein [Pandoraea bronchicola]
MDSRLIDWHAVRFIPEIGNMQGIDETVAWCGAATLSQGIRRVVRNAPPAAVTA